MTDATFSDYSDFTELTDTVADAVESGEAEVLDSDDENLVPLDADGDGAADIYVEDNDGDGIIDGISVDEDGDNVTDTAFLDTDQDGATDTVLTGVAEGDPESYGTMLVDEDQDGTLDSEYTYDASSGEWVEEGSSDTDSDSDISEV